MPTGAEIDRKEAELKAKGLDPLTIAAILAALRAGFAIVAWFLDDDDVAETRGLAPPADRALAVTDSTAR